MVEGIINTMVVERIISVFHSIQSTTSTKMDIRTLDTCMILSIKLRLVSIHLSKTSTTTRQYVQYASQRREAQCLWCPHGMIVHLAGPRSIMDTWWLNTTNTIINVTSSVSTRTRSMSLVPRPTRMVHYCTLWKGYVAPFRVSRTWMGESWRALYAPSDQTLPLQWKSRLQKKSWTLIAETLMI